jgi:hypothetical protein
VRRASAPPRLADWQTYGHTSEATLGNAAWKILAGQVDAEALADKIDRCTRCLRLAELATIGQGHLVRGCWHQAALLLFEQGLWPIPQLPESCRLCGASLKVHEQPEAICNRCLRAHQWTVAA